MALSFNSSDDIVRQQLPYNDVDDTDGTTNTHKVIIGCHSEIDMGSGGSKICCGSGYLAACCRYNPICVSF